MKSMSWSDLVSRRPGPGVVSVCRERWIPDGPRRWVSGAVLVSWRSWGARGRDCRCRDCCDCAWRGGGLAQRLSVVWSLRQEGHGDQPGTTEERRFLNRHAWKLQGEKTTVTPGRRLPNERAAVRKKFGFLSGRFRRMTNDWRDECDFCKHRRCACEHEPRQESAPCGGVNLGEPWQRSGLGRSLPQDRRQRSRSRCGSSAWILASTLPSRNSSIRVHLGHASWV